MNSHLPIKLLILDVDGVITDGTVSSTARGEEQKTFSFRDVDAVFEARRKGLHVALVTGETTEWVGFIAQRLEINHVVRGAKDKLEAVHSLAGELGFGLEETCYVGDGARDAPALAAVGLGLVPADAGAEAKAAAAVVLRSTSGRGAVDEAVRMVLAGRENAEPATVARSASEGELHEDSIAIIRSLAKESLAVQQMVAERLAPEIARAADLMVGALAGGGQVLAFGNGGSAADAEHLAAELVGRFELPRDGLAATALTTNTSVLTAVSNDFGHDEVFARQIGALARPGDLAVAISTSGRSPNVVAGVRAARTLGLPVVALIGEGGRALSGHVDLCLCVPSRSAARIQEAHRLIIHALCALIENRLHKHEGSVSESS